MECRKIWVLRGANIWAPVPVLEVELLIPDEYARAPSSSSELIQRLRERLPGTSLAMTGLDSPPLPHFLQALTLELQSLAGSPVKVGLVHRTPEPGLYRVIIEYEEE